MKTESCGQTLGEFWADIHRQLDHGVFFCLFVFLFFVVCFMNIHNS